MSVFDTTASVVKPWAPLRSCVLFALSAVLSVNPAFAQTGSTTSSGSSTSSSGSSPVTAAGPSIPQPTISTQTNSVEGDLLAFKALQSDGQAIGLDVAPLAMSGMAATKKVLILAPLDPLSDKLSTLACRSVIDESVDDQGDNDHSEAELRAVGARDLLGVETAISSTLALVQTIGSFFTTNETSLGLAGSPQDQALQDGIARSLRVHNIVVLIPGLNPPLSITTHHASQSPFLHDLKGLEDARTDLGNAVVQKTQWDAEEAAITNDKKQLSDFQAQDDANAKDHKAICGEHRQD